MSWESRNCRGRFYTRSRRVDGQIRRKYIGSGALAELIAERDERDRRLRKIEAEAEREERAQLDAIGEQVAQLADFADLVARAFLIVNGYHQHHRGGWRKRRGTKNEEPKTEQPEAAIGRRDAPPTGRCY